MEWRRGKKKIFKWTQYGYLYAICITNLKKLENQLHRSRTTWRRLVLPHLQRSRMMWQRLLLPHLRRSRTLWHGDFCAISTKEVVILPYDFFVTVKFAIMWYNFFILSHHHVIRLTQIRNNFFFHLFRNLGKKLHQYTKV